MRHPSAMCPLLAALLLAACGKKEPPPPATPPPTTVAVTTTTLPPPPTPAPTPPPVWREARWGMKKGDVLAAFRGEAQRLSSPAAFSQPQPGASVAGGSSDVTIPLYELGGAKFRVLFGFEGEALDRIHLAAAKPGPATCADVEKALVGTHGPPERRSRTGTSLRGEEIVWKKPDQTIVLSCGGVPSLGFVTVALDYLAP